MRHTPYQYAEALYEALLNKNHEERQALLKRTVTVMSKNGDMKLLDRMLEAYEKVFLTKQGLRKVDVESVSPLSDSLRQEIEKLLGSKVLLTEKINGELIAGLTLFVDNSIFIDASARTRINNL